MAEKEDAAAVRTELEALDAMLPALRRRVLDNDAVLEAIEEELAAADVAERRVRRRQAELAAREAELRERLVKLQNERDALEDLERLLGRPSAATSQHA
jgi:predicted RNase H-like nuclease (RuvC/YqgF family)